MCIYYDYILFRFLYSNVKYNLFSYKVDLFWVLIFRVDFLKLVVGEILVWFFDNE